MSKTKQKEFTITKIEQVTEQFATQVNQKLNIQIETFED